MGNMNMNINTCPKKCIGKSDTFKKKIHVVTVGTSTNIYATTNTCVSNFTHMYIIQVI